MKGMSQVVLLEKLSSIYGSLYDFSRIAYKGNRKERIVVGCEQHGFLEREVAALLQGKGCAKCGRARGHTKQKILKRSSTEVFVRKAKAIHGTKYDYSKVNYVSRAFPIVLICSSHGEFKRKPGRHLRGGYGSGCPKCGRESAGSILASSAEKFIAKARSVHGDRYSYDLVEYVNSKTPVTICCDEHGEFQQTPNRHLAGTNCPKCKPKQYSKIAIEWIERTAKAMRLKNVQHAENGGEVQISGTRYWVDGYHARSKTIFEFHGDCFHGNPSVYKANSRPNPYSDMTAKQLYRRTLAREAHLRELGYTVITIWESEYRRFRKG